MKKFFLLFLLLSSSFTIAVGQRVLSGSITDEAGDPLIGANVLVAGSTTGTVTDLDGNFTLDVPAGSTELIVSYIGFTEKRVNIENLTTVNIILSQGQLLDEVVVTALGIQRNSRDVVYANQTVNSEDLMTAPNKNTLEALRGKVAGVKITTGSGSVGASSRIVLRAEASLTGNNNALIVIDGIPVDNNSTGGGAGGGEAGFSDYGNRFNDLNPDDIASVTVLKGPSATSLYGSRGASGVLLITTKKGQKGQTKVTINSTTSMEKAYVLLQRQDQFGQGLINPDGSTNFDTGENFSWGPRFDGVVRPWTSPIDTDGDGTLEYLSRPYSAVPNQLENFFQTGRTNVNNIALSGGNDKFTYYASYANTYQKGILDNTDYTRNNLTLNASAELTSKLSSSFSISYANIDQNTAQEGARAFEGANAYANAIQGPVNIPYNELRDYKNPYHGFEGFYGSYTVNPYLVLYEYVNHGKISNVLGNFSLNYNLAKGLNINAKVGTNLVNTGIDEAVPTFSYKSHYAWEDNLALSQRLEGNPRYTSGGTYLRNNINSRNIDFTTTANYTRKLGGTEKFGLNTSIGYNIFDRTISNTTAQTQGGLVVPGVYNLGNSRSQPRSDQNDSRYRIMGFFGNAGVSMDNKLFLEYSARADYSSTLPVDNQAFFYQAIGASAILSDYLGLKESKNFNFLKLRGSFGTTGKDAGLYLLQSSYAGNPQLAAFGDIYDINFPFNGQTGFSKNGQIGNPNLKPELTTTLELGIDAGFFNDRVGVEYTYFSSKHDDQIVTVSLPRSSGFINTPKNVGQITNKGHEIALNLRPFTNRNGFYTDFNFTFTTFKNKVVKISDETDELVIWDSGRGVTLVAEEGLPFGTFKGQVPTYDPSGNPIVAGGLPVYTTIAEPIGNVQPKYIAGLSSKLGYKNLSFNFLLDGRQGSKMFSITKFYSEFNGTALTTTINDRKPFVIPNSVVQNEDGTFSPNTVATLADQYVDDGNWARNVIDASFLKLREVGLTYDLPKSITKRLAMSGASIGIFAKNPKFWLAKENTFADPEANGPGTVQTNITGVETSQTPPSKSFGVNINVQF